MNLPRREQNSTAVWARNKQGLEYNFTVIAAQAVIQSLKIYYINQRITDNSIVCFLDPRVKPGDDECDISPRVTNVIYNRGLSMARAAPSRGCFSLYIRNSYS